MAKNSKSTTTTPAIPSWLEPQMKSYTNAVMSLGDTDPSKYVAPASSLQQQAFARAARLGGGSYNPTTTSVATRPNPGGSTGVPSGYGPSLYTKLGVTPASVNGNEVAAGFAGDPDAEKSTSWLGGQKSLSGAITGSDHNPLSFDFGNENYWKSGGPSLGTSFGIGLAEKLGQPDLLKMVGMGKKATNAFDLWDTAENNAKDAGKLDYQGIFETRPDFQQHLAELPTKDPRGFDMLRKSYDTNQDGQVSGGEFAQWWLESTDDGKNFDTSQWTPEASYARKQAALGETAPQPAEVTPEDQSWLGESPYIDPNLLYLEAADLARRGANTDVKYRTFDPSRVEARLNPYRENVVDAAGAYYDEQLGRQISDNQARATMNNAYGGSRHGVADAELRRTSTMDRAKMNADLLYSGWNDAVAGDERETAGIFGADTANRDNLYKAAGFLGDIGTTASATERANIETMLRAGDSQRAIDAALRTGDIQLLMQIGSMLGINVQSFLGQTTSGPGQNGTMGALGGAATGASMGSMFGPVGAVVGGIGGGLLGSRG